MASALVCGAGGFIGVHLVNRLKQDGYWVRGVDLKHPAFGETNADDFVVADLRGIKSCHDLIDRRFDDIYQLAADMGGAGYIFTGDNDASIMHNSAMINLNILDVATECRATRLFYSSSACIYPAYNQSDPRNPITNEDSAYPANPDSEYGWEKLFSERLYSTFGRNRKLEVRIARYHNIFGPLSTWRGGREKAPAAIYRKIAEASDGAEIDIWGDGEQTRSFLYVDECIEGTIRLMRSDFSAPVNIGSAEMVSINNLVNMVIQISGKKLSARHIPGPLGVRGRTSDNKLLRRCLGWEPSLPLQKGLGLTYAWVADQVAKATQGTSRAA